MPTGNPFAPVIDVGGGAQIGPASGTISGSLGLGSGTVGDHHATAGILLLGGVLLLILHVKGKFRFSTTVG